MPYSYHKEGDKYVVTKKDTGKVVGHTKGTKEALKKYLAALHINANEGKVNENKFNPPGTPADINTNDPKKALEFFEGQYKAVSERMAEIMKRQGYKVSPSTQAFTNELSDYMDMYYNAIQYTKKFIKDNNLQESNTMKKSELKEMIAEIIKEVINESNTSNKITEVKVSTDTRVDFLAHLLQHVWNMGTGKNSIDFTSVAQSAINDMFDDSINEYSVYQGDVSKIKPASTPKSGEVYLKDLKAGDKFSVGNSEYIVVKTENDGRGVEVKYADGSGSMRFRSNVIVTPKLNEAYVPSNIKDFAKRKGVSSLVNTVAGWAEKVGKGIRGGTAIGKDYSTLILDMGYQTADIYINTEDGTIKLYGEPVGNFKEFKDVFNSQQAEETNESVDTTPKHKIIAQLMGPDFFLSKKPESTWDEKDHELFNRITKMASEEGEVPKGPWNESVDYDTAVAYRLTVKGDRDAAMANVKSLLDNLTTGKSKKFPEVKVVMLPSKGNPQDIILKLNGPGAFSMSKDIKARPELKGIKVSTYKPQLSKIS